MIFDVTATGSTTSEFGGSGGMEGYACQPRNASNDCSGSAPTSTNQSDIATGSAIGTLSQAFRVAARRHWAKAIFAPQGGGAPKPTR